MPLRAEQVSRYIDIGREHGFDAVLTISNQITASPDESPVSVEARKGGKKVPLRHLSWWQVMTEARVHHIHRGVSDPDRLGFWASSSRTSTTSVPARVASRTWVRSGLRCETQPARERYERLTQASVTSRRAGSSS